MSRPPELHELVGDDLSPAERERLERVHQLLVAAGPPPELPQSLTAPPVPEGRVVTLVRNRLRTGLVLAAALVIAAFAAGYFLGAGDSESASRASFTPVKTAVLGTTPDRLAVVRIGEVDENGNRPMLITVEGLDRLSGGDYYTLFMTRKGKPLVECGTFNVSDDGPTTVEFSVAYDLDRYDGLMLAEYRLKTHKDTPLLETRL